MQRPDGVAWEFVKEPFGNHALCAGTGLFRGLEDKVHSARKIARLSQVFGGPQQDRGVAVVTAGVHLARRGRGVFKTVLLLHRQRVHLGSQADTARIIALSQHADHAGSRHAAMHLDAPALKSLRHDVRGAMFFIAQLWVGMEITPPCGHFVVEFGNVWIDRHLRDSSRFDASLAGMPTHMEIAI